MGSLQRIAQRIATDNAWRRLLAGLAVAGCAAALAACGSSGASGDGSRSSAQSAGIKFSDCMRSHGVSNFPDPGPGGGIQIGSGSGINPQSPAFQSAQAVCQKLLPGGGPGRGPGSEQRKLRLLRLAQCMRRHGISAFPDPTSGPPSTLPAGGGIAFGGGGAFISVPQTMMDSPGFQQAANECGFPGAGRGGPKAAPAP